MGKNKLYDKKHEVRDSIRDPFGYAKDRAVTPQRAPTHTLKDRVGSHTDVPSRTLPQSESLAPRGIVQGTPVQGDGTILTKLPPNVQAGPDSTPWFRRDVKTIPNQGQERVLLVEVPEGKVFRLERIGHTYWSPFDEFWIVYDDKLLNDRRWSFSLGTPANLYKLPVSVSATVQIECHVLNRSGGDRLYEFFLDGYFDQLTFLEGSRTS